MSRIEEEGATASSLAQFDKSIVSLAYTRPDVEAAYQKWFTATFTPTFRVCYFVGSAAVILKYSFESGLDHNIDAFYTGLLGGLIPCIIALLLSSWNSFFAVAHEFVNISLFLLLGCISIIGGDYVSNEILSPRTVVEIYLLFFVFAMSMRFRFLTGVACSWVVFVIYVIILGVGVNQPPATPCTSFDPHGVLDIVISLILYSLAGVVSFNILSRGQEQYTRHIFEVLRNKQTETSRLRGQIDELRAKQQQDDKTKPMQPPDAPVTRILNLLRDLDQVPRKEIISRVEQVTKILGSANLYALDIDEVRDDEINAWLNNLLAENVGQDDNMSQSSSRVIRAKETDGNRSKGSLPDVDEEASSTAGDSVSVHDTELTSVLQLSQEPQLMKLLETVHIWEHDIFQLAKLSNNHPLLYMSITIFRNENLFQKLAIPEEKFIAFVAAVENGYHLDNPYHSSIHAADVLQNTYYFINSAIRRSALSDLEMLGLLVGAMVHDYAHPGVTNAFLINSGHPLALRYNDRSVLENFHAAESLKLLTKPQTNFALNFSKSQLQQFRSLIVDLVLSTDVSRHFEFISKFDAKISGGNRPDLSKRDDLDLVMGFMLKCADMGNPAKAPFLNRQWVSRIMEEYYLQGDKERAAGRDISTFMDRTKPNVPKCQSSFVDFLVRPLYTKWATYADNENVYKCIDYLEENYAYWKSENAK